MAADNPYVNMPAPVLAARYPLVGRVPLEILLPGERPSAWCAPHPINPRPLNPMNPTTTQVWRDPAPPTGTVYPIPDWAKPEHKRMARERAFLCNSTLESHHHVQPAPPRDLRFRAPAGRPLMSCLLDDLRGSLAATQQPPADHASQTAAPPLNPAPDRTLAEHKRTARERAFLCKPTPEPHHHVQTAPRCEPRSRAPDGRPQMSRLLDDLRGSLAATQQLPADHASQAAILNPLHHAERDALRAMQHLFDLFGLLEWKHACGQHEEPNLTNPPTPARREQAGGVNDLYSADGAMRAPSQLQEWKHTRRQRMELSGATSGNTRAHIGLDPRPMNTNSTFTFDNPDLSMDAGTPSTALLMGAQYGVNPSRFDGMVYLRQFLENSWDDPIAEFPGEDQVSKCNLRNPLLWSGLRSGWVGESTRTTLGQRHDKG